MAALGAAAGAFEGDNAREEQRARRAGLGLQAAQLAQQDRQFVDRQTLEREQMALEQQRFQGNQDIANSRTAMEQRNADRAFSIDEKKMALGQENDLYQRGRNEQQDAWKSALDEQTIKEKQQAYAQNEAAYQDAAKIRKQFDDQLANRKKVVQSVAGTLIRDIAESPNHVLSPALIKWAQEKDPETYGNLSGGGGGKPGEPMFFGFKDPKTGEDKVEPIDVDKQYLVFDTLYGPEMAKQFTGRQEQEAQNAFTVKRDRQEYELKRKSPEEQAISQISYFTRAIDEANKIGDQDTIKFFTDKLETAKKNAGVQKKELSKEEKAIEWANKNPDDPRSKTILKMLNK